MNEIERKQSLREETAVLVGLVLPDEARLAEPPLAELERLAATAGVGVVDRVVQKRPAVQAGTYIGRGKAEEIAGICAALAIDVVIFDHDLSPAQIRNLERLIERRVVDRSELILDIFATRAQTRQARVQVELAQLRYLRPRLTRLWTHLSRHEGGIGKGGPIGLRGPGEKQLEVDRRLMDRRIDRLTAELEQIERRHHTQARGRRGFFSIALVGYTNAGKSTLLNALTGSDALTEDKLFATLDTTTRAWNLPNGKRVFLSDTVGFIRGLPHHLVASFHATLEEAREADLLLHVVDASNPDADAQMKTAIEVLEEIGAGEVPRVTVLNKADLVADRLSLGPLRNGHPRTVDVSARSGEGLDQLAAQVLAVIESGQVEVEVVAHPGDGKLMAFLAEKGRILSREYRSPEEVRLVVRLPQRYAAQVAT